MILSKRAFGGDWEMKWLSRTGGVLLRPRTVFERILHQREGGIGDVLLLMALVMLGTAPVEVAMVVSSTSGILVKLLSVYVRFCLLPLVVCVALALVLVGMERFRGNRVPIESMMAAGVYLWIPVGMLGLLGTMLRALGLDLWFLPHMPLGYFFKTEPSVLMIFLRVVCAYGWSAYLVWVLVKTMRAEKPDEPRPYGQGRFVLAGWVLLAYISGSIFVATHYDSIRPVQPGDTAKAFELERADKNEKISLASLSGKVVVLDFWGTWCPKCVEHMGELLRFARANPEVAVLAIHQGGPRDEVAGFVKARKWAGAVFLVDDLGVVSLAYRAESVPAYFVIGPDGSIRAVRYGVPQQGWLEKHARSE
jgi:thiol-disulfide isomerase/thioredoxin